jgi:hypothetical protein
MPSYGTSSCGVGPAFYKKFAQEVCCVDSHCRIWTLRRYNKIWTSHDLSDLCDCQDFLGDCRAFHGAGARGWGGTSINLVCWGAPCPAESWWPIPSTGIAAIRGTCWGCEKRPAQGEIHEALPMRLSLAGETVVIIGQTGTLSFRCHIISHINYVFLR